MMTKQIRRLCLMMRARLVGKDGDVGVMVRAVKTITMTMVMLMAAGNGDDDVGNYSNDEDHAGQECESLWFVFK